MSTKSISILGSTGSIGRQCLQIVAEHTESYRVLLLSANTNQDLLKQQLIMFKPKVAVINSTPEASLIETAKRVGTALYEGVEQLPILIEQLMPQLVVNALVGFAGFASSVRTLELGIPLALANKESLVVGGKALTEIQSRTKAQIIPVDSEHSAMLQCLVGEDQADIRNIIITASGGPFRTWSLEEMKKATVKEALNHPNWDMGAKITIDSASMMNKGLEIIEAHWLFDLPLDQIIPVIHPQSVIHSMVEFRDGSTKAQLGPPDMRVPISYALSFPERSAYFTPVLDWTQRLQLDFEPIDENKFPCLSLAKQAVLAGGLHTTVMNAANEVAVEAFLQSKISFMQIPAWIETALEKVNADFELVPEHIHAVDQDTRIFMSNHFNESSRFKA